MVPYPEPVSFTTLPEFSPREGELRVELDLVAAETLCEREGVPRGLDKLGRLCAVTGVEGQPGAGSEAQFRVLGRVEAPGGHALAESFGRVDASFLIRVGKDDRELISAEPRTQVYLSDHPAQAPGEPRQHVVACLVAMALVHQMELIEVQDQQREGVAESIGAIALVFQSVLERPVAGHSRETVDVGLLGRIGHDTRLLSAQCGYGADGRHGRECKQRLGARRPAVDPLRLGDEVRAGGDDQRTRAAGNQRQATPGATHGAVAWRTNDYNQDRGQGKRKRGSGDPSHHGRLLFLFSRCMPFDIRAGVSFISEGDAFAGDFDVQCIS